MKLKRLLALLCVLVMLVSAMPATVYAAERLPEPVETQQPTSIADEEVGGETVVSVDEVPLYLQNDEEWKNVRYGNVYLGDGRYATIGSHGCGPTCLAMVASYLLDKEYTPVDAAEEFGIYNTAEGSYWILFEDSAKTLEIELQERTYRREVVMEALANGQVVVSLQSTGLFTGGGHFIVLVGLTEDGNILVNDPNGKNYEKDKLKDGFENGFTEHQIFANGGPYWIYAKKVDNSETVTESTNTKILPKNTVEFKREKHGYTID